MDLRVRVWSLRGSCVLVLSTLGQSCSRTLRAAVERFAFLASNDPERDQQSATGAVPILLDSDYP